MFVHFEQLMNVDQFWLNSSIGMIKTRKKKKQHLQCGIKHNPELKKVKDVCFSHCSCFESGAKSGLWSLCLALLSVQNCFA